MVLSPNPIGTTFGNRRVAPLTCLALLAFGLSGNLALVCHAQTSDSQALPSAPSSSATVTGTITDTTGALISNATVTLRLGEVNKTAISQSDGTFTFTDAPAGAYTITASLKGFATASTSGTLAPGQHLELPPISMKMADLNVSVQAVTQKELAQMEVHAEEQQRVLGLLPNFFVAYDWKAPPLTSRQKFSLVFTTFRDPINVLIAAGVAGVQQSQDDFAGYGQGAQGYGKRFGANYGGLVIGTVLGGGVYPVLFHQDPRYFYKGTGSVRSRMVYAMSRAIITRGDNGKPQFAVASVLGDFSAGAISNAYYPAEDRGSVGVTFENGLIAVGSDAIGNLFQEFIVRKFTPKSRRGVINAVTTTSSSASH